MKKIGQVLLGIIILVILIVGGYILFMTVTDYKPEDKIKLSIERQTENKLNLNDSFSITTFNIGYAGMDDEQDFFMDGGKGSRSSSKEKTMENMKEITTFLKKDHSSFIFLQEVDTNSTRSFRINQYDYLKNNLKAYSSSMALNYKTPWVPVPVLKPHGTVNAGLVNLSKYKVNSATRYQYPGKESWPRQLAELDRCFLESRISLENDKELVLINSHLSAYDKGGKIRKQQLSFLRNYIIKEYKKGNYIIVGGDWNHLIPGTDPLIFKTTEKWPDWLQKIPNDFKPKEFKWVADKNVPTTRTDATPYKKGENFTAVIDGFLVSDNIEVISVKAHSMDFKNIDHNPVNMKFKLK
ncbi:endonuclease/Exonuclease/phosphatase family protein [Clostridium sporogenes]|uniref:Endonuclease/Exonuclease/phosphatase family protein n=1 Tax=Clostridium sporogenes TaxID=1509 RepID=A0A1L3NCV4_CLOSG|nr:endonuclease/exonuclease/phosphatase family protein [Clostridium sporogenes]APH13959.1 endonuclease/Exonuclease/phosphatase family protein [Clostridium sporogenes]